MPAPQNVELEASQSLPVPLACPCVPCCANRAVTSFQLFQLSWISLLHQPWAGNRAKRTLQHRWKLEQLRAGWHQHFIPFSKDLVPLSGISPELWKQQCPGSALCFRGRLGRAELTPQVVCSCFWHGTRLASLGLCPVRKVTLG